MYAYLVSPGRSLLDEASTPTLLSQEDLSQVHDDTEVIKKLGERYLDSQNRLTGDFYASSQQTFEVDGLDAKAQKEVFKKLKGFKSSTQSTLAKLDLIHVARELETLNFEFKICEIERPGYTRRASQEDESSSERSESVDDDSVDETSEGIEDAPSGLENLGYSCYMNALLQALYFIPPVRHLVKVQKEGEGILKPLATALEKRDRASLKALRDAVFALGHQEFPKHGIGEQQDVHSLLCLFFSKLGWHPMQTYTSLSYEIPNVAQNGHDTQAEPASHLSVSIRAGRSFQELIDDYFAEETVDDVSREVTIDEDTYHVLPYQQAERIVALPQYLVVQLKRFGNYLQKNLEKIGFPEDGGITLQQRANDPETRYEIIGYINHHGRFINGGHYTAHLKDEDERWLYFNDEKVREIEPKEASRSAYIVILRQI